MLLETLGSANAPIVLGAIGRLGEKARFTDIRNASHGLGDSQVSRALKELNKLGLVAGRPEADRTMRYALTKAGSEALGLMRDFHAIIHKRHGPVAEATDRELERILVA